MKLITILLLTAIILPSAYSSSESDIANKFYDSEADNCSVSFDLSSNGNISLNYNKLYDSELPDILSLQGLKYIEEDKNIILFFDKKWPWSSYKQVASFSYTEDEGWSFLSEKHRIECLGLVHNTDLVLHSIK